MIEIRNLTKVKIDRKALTAVAKKVLKSENIKLKGLSVVFLGSGEIRKLNKKYRGKNQPTDVLSFNQDCNFPFSEEELGEIAICPQQVKKNAERLGEKFKKELSRVLIHGILHLLGYDHEKNVNEARRMEEKQEYYLSLFFKI